MTLPFTFVVFGCGSRGRTYTRIAHHLGHRLVAAADPQPAALAAMAGITGEPAPTTFETGEALLAGERLADLAFVATQDALHFDHASAALRRGYHVVLEKPAARSSGEVEELARLARENDRKLILCFVLRYTPFYRTLKQALDEGRIGEVVSMQASEGVNPWHHVHSYVRGHWSRYPKSTPMIVAKCSHDTDILTWFAGAPCTSVASFASCTHFRPEGAPDGATPRCTDGCPHLGACAYDAHRYLGDQRRWLGMVRPDAAEMDDDAIMAWLKTGDWGRCAYHCGQDTPDHQVVSLRFANGITADLTMTAFDTGRRIRIYGTEGILEGAMHADGREPWIELRKHTGGISPLPLGAQHADGYEGHGGGDYGLIEALPGFLSDKGPDRQFDFIEGHRIAFAAAKSADTGEAVHLRPGDPPMA